MTSPDTQPITVVLYQGNRRLGAFLLALFGISFGYSGYIAIQADNIVAAVLLGLPGLILLFAAGVTFFTRSTARPLQLVFDSDGFRYQTRSSPGWTVRWAELDGITVHLEFRQNERESGRDIHSVRYLDFWPATEATAGRPDLAHLWQAHDAEGRFRLYLMGGKTAAAGIERAVGTVRRDLWRTDDPTDRGW